MRKRATVLMLAAVIGVAGCATTVSITPERIGSIRSVGVTPEVKLPPVASYHGPEGAWGAALGGIVGALIAQGAVKAPDQIKAYIAQENIDVGEIVRTQFMKGLQADSRFATKLGDGGDARFELEVFLYGLVSNGPFSGQFRPWLGIQAKLVEPSGKTIWQDRDHVFLDGAVPLAPYKAYFDDPATFRVGFAAAADAVTHMLLKKL